MRTGLGRWFLAVLLAGVAGLASVPSSRAQMRSLGGYGASTIGSYYRSMGGPLIPYGGGQGGFVPYEGLQRRPSAPEVLAPRELPATPVGGVSMPTTPIGGASRVTGPGLFYQPLRYRGRFGTGGRAIRARDYGPGFGSPFRVPPSLSRGGM